MNNALQVIFASRASEHKKRELLNVISFVCFIPIKTEWWRYINRMRYFIMTAFIWITSSIIADPESKSSSTSREMKEILDWNFLSSPYTSSYYSFATNNFLSNLINGFLSIRSSCVRSLMGTTARLSLSDCKIKQWDTHGDENSSFSSSICWDILIHCWLAWNSREAITS